MEEVATCKGCGSQIWTIYKDRMECPKCKKVIKFVDDLMPSDLIHLTNDNF